MKTPGIPLNNTIGRNTSASISQPHIRRYRQPSTADADTGSRQRLQHPDNSLEVYAGTGKARTERPALRGTNIDITV